MPRLKKDSSSLERWKLQRQLREKLRRKLRERWWAILSKDDGKDDDDTNRGNENVWNQSLKWDNFRVLW